MNGCVWILILTDIGWWYLRRREKSKSSSLSEVDESWLCSPLSHRQAICLSPKLGHISRYFFPWERVILFRYHLSSCSCSQFYGLFPHFYSLYLSLCHFVEGFFLFFPGPPPLSPGWPLHLGPASPPLSESSPGWWTDPSSLGAMCQTRIKYNELQRVHSRWHSGCLCAEENTTSED